jgi:hypothetical protein
VHTEVWVGKTSEKWSLKRKRWKDNINIDLSKIESDMCTGLQWLRI